MLIKSIGRFFSAIIKVLSLGFINISDKLEDNVEVLGLEYDDIINKTAISAKQIKDAVGGLMAQQEIAGQKLEMITSEIEEAEVEAQGYQALAAQRVETLRNQGKSDDEIMIDSEVTQYQSAYGDVVSTLEEKKKRAQDLEQQIQDQQGAIDTYVIRGQEVAREAENLRSEKYEAKADMAASKKLDEINEALAGISTGGTGEKLNRLRQRRMEARGKAKASQRIAGTDITAQRAKAKAAAKTHIANKDFLAGLGLGEKKDVVVPDSTSKTTEADGTL